MEDTNKIHYEDLEQCDKEFLLQYPENFDNIESDIDIDKFKHLQLTGMPDEIMDELLRVPDNFENILENIIDDDETLPEMEAQPLKVKDVDIESFDCIEEIDYSRIEQEIIKVTDLSNNNKIGTLLKETD